MASSGGQEKTEKATAKKRRDAREKEGKVLQSKEINTAASLFFIFFGLYLVGKYMFDQLMEVTAVYINEIGKETTINIEFMSRLLLNGAKNWVMTLTPLIAISIVVPIIATAIQTKGLFTMKPVAPKFSKLNPFSGVKRLFSMQTFVNVIKSVIVIAVISILVYDRISKNIEDFKQMPRMEIEQSVVYMAKTTFSIVMLIVAIVIFVSVADYLYQWWEYERNLRMSKQEVKDEYKNIEGDPAIKSKIKQKQREMAQQRMMEKVPDSDVVVRNPTHYAVAIKYERGNIMAAPTVVAKGKDALALKIISIAEEHDVYVTENRPLARELYDTVELEAEIPPSLYNAIAVILTDMYTEKGISIEDGTQNFGKRSADEG